MYETKLLHFLESINISNNEKLMQKLFDLIKNKLDIKNILIFLTLFDSFKISDLKIATLNYIYRSFTIITDTLNFLELDFQLIAKILSSSQLCITSEFEVFNAADAWIRHNFIKRSNHAKNLLLKVRFPLLTDEALEYVLQKSSSFRRNDDCLVTINKILKKNFVFCKKSRGNFTYRYCDQNMFKILVCGGDDSNFKNTKNIYQLDVKDVKKIKLLNNSFNRRLAKAVVVKDAVYFFGGYTEGNFDPPISSVEKYSFTTNRFEKVADLNIESDSFCVCAFMDKIYIVAGPENDKSLTRCMKFDTNDRSFKTIASLNEFRRFPACSVFQEKLVVSGGNDSFDLFGVPLDTVEVYDHVSDEWSHFSNMVSGRARHASIAARNKIFVSSGTGCGSCEVFDSVSNKFTFISPQFFHSACFVTV